MLYFGKTKDIRVGRDNWPFLPGSFTIGLRYPFGWLVYPLPERLEKRLLRSNTLDIHKIT